nr:MAG: coat protein [Yunnan phenui-like virus]
MSTSTVSNEVLKAVDKVLAASSSEERVKVFAGMAQPLKKEVRKEIKRREEEGSKGKKPEKSGTEGDSEPEDDDLGDIDWSKIGGPPDVKKKVRPPKGVASKIEITEKELDEIWASIESEDTSEYDLDVASAFDYQGFNAGQVLTQVMARGKRAGLEKTAILKDISLMAALAHKKGSINDKNYPKMKKAGQTEYDRLAGIYGLVKGGAKGMPPETVTISRIGPTFSARIMRLILDGKLEPKKFTGPFRSSTLHSVMQTQFFVSCLSTSIPERSLDWLIGLCRAYSSDQTLALAVGKKPSAEEVWDKQLSFVELTKNADHPSQEARKSMMAKIPWPEVYDKTASCTAAVKKIDNTFTGPTRTEFLSDISKV